MGLQSGPLARLTSLNAIAGRLLRSRHLYSLLSVAAGCLIGQAAILTRRPLTYQLPDSPSYVALASRSISHPSLSALFDSYRTPGYPAFLALVGACQGQVAGDWVAWTQAALMVVTAFELYALTCGLTGSRFAAAVAGIAFATNVRLLDWERLVMTEALAVFLVTTMALAFWLWMRRHGRSWAVAFCLVSMYTCLTRPSLLYLPICLALAVLVSNRQRWSEVLLVSLAVYLPVLGYAAVNDRLHPHAGLSAVSNINLLGKVLEYQMQGEGDAARFPSVSKGISSLHRGDADPYHILQADPGALGVNYVDAAAFSEGVITRQPGEYLTRSAADFLAQGVAVPYAYIPSGRFEWATRGLAAYALIAYAAYPSLPLLVAGLGLLWRRLDREVALGVGALLVAVIGSLATNALFTYVDFARLRTPVDALAFVAAISVSSHLMRLLTRKQARGYANSTAM